MRACRGRWRAAGDLAALSELALASVSEHLKVLRKAGVLKLDKRGRYWLYQTDAEVLHNTAAAMRAMARGR